MFKHQLVDLIACFNYCRANTCRYEDMYFISTMASNIFFLFFVGDKKKSLKQPKEEQKQRATKQK